MSRRTAVALFGIAAAVLIAIGVTAFVVTRGPAGEPTPEAVVASYVAALRDQDRARLKQIADPDYDSQPEITQRLQRLGGDRLVVERTQISDTESDHEKSATITGTLDGAPFSEDLWLAQRHERWYVALGPNKNAHPKGTGG